jgi:hypothetical protein
MGFQEVFDLRVNSPLHTHTRIGFHRDAKSLALSGLLIPTEKKSRRLLSAINVARCSALEELIDDAIEPSMHALPVHLYLSALCCAMALLPSPAPAPTELIEVECEKREKERFIGAVER